MPKPFAGAANSAHIAMIQRNALRSWRLACPEARIVLLGDEAGVAEAARELGCVHVPEAARSEYGTPLISDLFARIERHSDTPYFNYLNADILLTSDFGRAFAEVTRRKKRFLIVGQRCDFGQTTPLEFGPGWEDDLRQRAAREGKLHRPTGIDYFVYNRGLWGKLPPFAVGRPSWDNWMIYRARQLNVSIIDATPVVTAVHQNHDYRHAARGFKGAWYGPEARRNLTLAGGSRHLFTIWDSTHVLTPTGLVRRTNTGLGGGIWSYRRSLMYGG